MTMCTQSMTICTYIGPQLELSLPAVAAAAAIGAPLLRVAASPPLQLQLRVGWAAPRLDRQLVRGGMSGPASGGVRRSGGRLGGAGTGRTARSSRVVTSPPPVCGRSLVRGRWTGEQS
jgi:hypothetical protein